MSDITEYNMAPLYQLYAKVNLIFVHSLHPSIISVGLTMHHGRQLMFGGVMAQIWSRVRYAIWFHSC